MGQPDLSTMIRWVTLIVCIHAWPISLLLGYAVCVCVRASCCQGCPVPQAATRRLREEEFAMARQWQGARTATLLIGVTLTLHTVVSGNHGQAQSHGPL